MHPSKANLAFRVGIAGHRWNRLGKADLVRLGRQVNEILRRVKKSVDEFKGEQSCQSGSHGAVNQAGESKAACLRIISSLAEGADRIVAEEAVGLGYELQCPMPFAQDLLEEDFKPRPPDEPEGTRARTHMETDSVAEFRGILDRARQETGLVIFELDGDAHPPSKAYVPAARAVLNQSDLLILVWDGRDEAKPGGTLETLFGALALHIPVVWIDARAPHACQLLRSRSDLAPPTSGQAGGAATYQPTVNANDSDLLKAAVHRTLAPPTVGQRSGKDSSPDLREAFFRERQRKWTWAVVWKMFRNCLGDGRLVKPAFVVPNYEKEVEGGWPCTGQDYLNSQGEPIGTPLPWEAELNRTLRPHYAWADKLADFYADSYRSSFLLTYFLGALAVFLALICMAAGWVGHEYHVHEVVFIGAELLVIVTIMALVAIGNRRRWHERWMDYRLVAELIRQLRYLVPLGASVPLPRLPAHLSSYGNPAETWMYWHVRAIERELGLPNLKVDREFLAEYVQAIRTRLIQGQEQFHKTTEERMDRIDHRLHRLGYVLFGATLLACLLHFVPHMGSDHLHHAIFFHNRVPNWLTLLAAVLPAFGAAVAAIRNQGEFSRVAKRSRAMREHLHELDSQFADLEQRLKGNGPGVNSSAVTHLATEAIQLMVNEVLDWRVVFRDRPLVPPA